MPPNRIVRFRVFEYPSKPSITLLDGNSNPCPEFHSFAIPFFSAQVKAAKEKLKSEMEHVEDDEELGEMDPKP